MPWRPYLATSPWRFWIWQLQHPTIRRTGPFVWQRRMTKAAIRARVSDALRSPRTKALVVSKLGELVSGDGFVQLEGDLDGYCPMCGRSRTNGHREACARYVIADAIDLLKREEARA